MAAAAAIVGVVWLGESPTTTPKNDGRTLDVLPGTTPALVSTEAHGTSASGEPRVATAEPPTPIRPVQLERLQAPGGVRSSAPAPRDLMQPSGSPSANQLAGYGELDSSPRGNRSQRAVQPLENAGENADAGSPRKSGGLRRVEEGEERLLVPEPQQPLPGVQFFVRPVGSIEVRHPAGHPHHKHIK